MKNRISHWMLLYDHCRVITVVINLLFPLFVVNDCWIIVMLGALLCRLRFLVRNRHILIHLSNLCSSLTSLVRIPKLRHINLAIVIFNSVLLDVSDIWGHWLLMGKWKLKFWWLGACFYFLFYHIMLVWKVIV